MQTEYIRNSKMYWIFFSNSLNSIFELFNVFLCIKENNYSYLHITQGSISLNTKPTYTFENCKKQLQIHIHIICNLNQYFSQFWATISVEGELNCLHPIALPTQVCTSRVWKQKGSKCYWIDNHLGLLCIHPSTCNHYYNSQYTFLN